MWHDYKLMNSYCSIGMHLAADVPVRFYQQNKPKDRKNPLFSNGTSTYNNNISTMEKRALQIRADFE